MRSSIKRYLSIFFLFLFVFPYVQKGVHDLEHSSDIHCADKSSAHFHETSHTCSLCDYTISKAATPVQLVEIGFVQISLPFLFSEIQSTPFESLKCLFLLRGPPALS